eukprot:Opistho-2@49417
MVFAWLRRALIAVAHETKSAIPRTTRMEAAASAQAAQAVASGEEPLYQAVRVNGRYVNPFPTWEERSLLDVLKWRWNRDDKSGVPTDPKILDQTMPVLRPDFENLAQKTLPGEAKVTWIGHATVLVQLDGLNIITDPIFSERCAPVQFIGPKRYRPTPCSIDELPKIHAVVLSHDHYDHTDTASLRRLNEVHSPAYFVPMGMKDYLKSICVDEKRVFELTWWQEHLLEGTGVKFACVPVQHWCRRTINNRNVCLWGGWVVQGPSENFFFAGDTAYCGSFKQIGKKYGPITLSAIPIGAYEPSHSDARRTAELVSTCNPNPGVERMKRCSESNPWLCNSPVTPHPPLPPSPAHLAHHILDRVHTHTRHLTL